MPPRRQKPSARRRGKPVSKSTEQYAKLDHQTWRQGSSSKGRVIDGRPRKPRRRAERLVATSIGAKTLPLATSQVFSESNVEPDLEYFAVKNLVIFSLNTEFPDIFGGGP